MDSWIDKLDENASEDPTTMLAQGLNQQAVMGWMIQAYLPKIELPIFDGTPLKWVNFIVKFREVVHKQEYLHNSQRNQLLIQHLEDEAERAVRAFANNPKGYVLSLKKLKYIFGQRSTVARATLQKVTKGKEIPNDDVEGLSELCYSITECLTVLKQLNYESDLNSSDTLRQVIQRLPRGLQLKWGEHSIIVKRFQEPSLVHLEEWLHARVLARKEANLPASKKKKDDKKFTGTLTKQKQKEEKEEGSAFTGSVTISCLLCKESHGIWKCKDYIEMTPKKRFDTAKGHGICFNCFSNEHKSWKCTSNKRCFKGTCGGKHHTTLHDFFIERGDNRKGPVKEDAAKDDTKVDPKDGQAAKKGILKKEDEKAKDPPAKDKDGKAFAGLTSASQKAVVERTESESSSDDEEEVILQIVPISLLGNKGKVIDTYGLLDNGSQSTLIREDMARKLKLRGKRKKIRIGTIKDKGQLETKIVAPLSVSARDGSNKMPIKKACITPASSFNMPSKPSFKKYAGLEMYKHLDGLDFEPVKPRDITILIGGDVPKAVVTWDVREGSDDEPLAVKTSFGWTLFGNSSDAKRELQPPVSSSVNMTLEHLWNETEKIPVTHVNLIHSESDQILHKSVERLWVQENLGILPEKEFAMSQEDIGALATLEEETVLLDNGKYQAPMLWNSPDTTLPNNLPLALKRFHYLEKRLKRDSEIHKRMKKVIDGYLAEDPPHARKMSAEEAASLSPRTWYLPIHPVFNPKKPEKTRVVNDAAAVFEGESLNSNVRSGPDLLSSLVGILLKFRTGTVAIAADVEGMFHQVRVCMEDADSLRFLWKDNVLADGLPDVYQMLVHIFGAKDSPACANYILKRIARDNYKDFSSETYLSVLKNFYVDDLLKAVHSDKEAIKLANELVVMLKRGGFRLTKFLSNSKKVLDALPPTEVSQCAVMEIDVEKLERALGVYWDTVKDVFTFVTNLKDNPATKKGILSTSSSLFDPLGFLVPFLIVARLLLQELWRQGYEWDQPIEGKLLDIWNKWLDGVKLLDQIRVSRQYVNSDESVQEIQLHVFCDASEAAYGCVAYLRVTLKSNTHTCSLVMSKSRLAPIKTITLPRLELSAARAGARLSRLIVHEIDLPISRLMFWSDSTLTLQYIRNKKNRMKVFVANRVTEILELTEENQWRHIPGNMNVADMLTRGVMDPLKLNSSDWFTGPEFLKKEETEWPNESVPALCDEDCEIKRRTLLVALNLVVSETIDPARISSWTRLRRVAAWVLRFYENTKQKEKEKRNLSQTLQVVEIVTAERFLVRDAQSSSFTPELKLLKENGNLPDSNKLSSLCPFIDEEGLLRVGGRLKFLQLPMEAKHPAILSREHPITHLIIDWIHRKNGHVGREHVLAILRQKYWVVAARTAINAVIRVCFLCRIRRAKQKYPIMANLPCGRADFDNPPFSNCGVDLFGPITVKQGRKQLKRWVCLYTCLTVRCIHLEVVETTETDSFISSTRRFTNRRGCPLKMYSDNGTNFVGASNELEEFINGMNQDAIKDFTTSLHIEWIFNPPKAPHMGGAWERLVRSVKEVMFGILQNHVLTDPQLNTVLTEVENIVNSRPLTHISDDVKDLEPLTPNHILLGHHRNWSAIIDTNASDVFSRKKWRQVQGVSCQFWSRWKKEYLPMLTKRSKWKTSGPSYKPGDLVLLHDDDFSKRGKWPLARITKVKPGVDGAVRVVELRTKDGEFTRPVTKLYHLEDDIELSITKGVQEGAVGAQGAIGAQGVCVQEGAVGVQGAVSAQGIGGQGVGAQGVGVQEDAVGVQGAVGVQEACAKSVLMTVQTVFVKMRTLFEKVQTVPEKVRIDYRRCGNMYGFHNKNVPRQFIGRYDNYVPQGGECHVWHVLLSLQMAESYHNYGFMYTNVALHDNYGIVNNSPCEYRVFKSIGPCITNRLHLYGKKLDFCTDQASYMMRAVTFVIVVIFIVEIRYL